MDIRLQKRDIFVRGKFPAEFIDIYRFVILFCTGIIKIFLLDELYNIPVFIQCAYRSVHPVFIFGHYRQIGHPILYQTLYNGRLIDQIRLQEHRVISAQVVSGQIQGIDIIAGVVYSIVYKFKINILHMVQRIFHQFCSMVSNHQYHLMYPGSFQGITGMLQQCFSRDPDHAFCLILCVFLQPLPHTCS